MLKNILLALTDCVLAYNIDKNDYVFICDGIEQIWGVKPEYLRTHDDAFAHLVYPPDLEKYRNLAQPTSINHSVEFEYRILVNQQLKLITEKQTLITNPETGDTILLRAFKELPQYNIIESITDCLCAVDADLEFLWVNTSFEKILQLTREEVIGRPLIEFFPESKNTSFEQACRDSIQKQQSQQVIEYFARLNIWLDIATYPYNGGLIFLFKNISKQKLLNDETLLRKTNLESLINNTNDLIWSVDRQLNFTAMNAAFKKAIGATTGKKLAEGDSALINGYPQDTLTTWKGYYERALNGEAYTLPRKMTFRDTNSLFEISFNPIYNKKKRIIGAGCFARDITDHAKAEESIDQQNKKLRSISLLSSHELRGPVATILGLTSVFDADNICNPENLHIVNHIRTASEELDRVIREIVANTFIINNQP